MLKERTIAFHCSPRNFLVCFIVRSYCNRGFECLNGGYCIDLTHCVCPPHYSGEIVSPRRQSLQFTHKKINRFSLSTYVFIFTFLYQLFLQALERARGARVSKRRAKKKNSCVSLVAFHVFCSFISPRINILFSISTSSRQNRKSVDRLQQIKQKLCSRRHAFQRISFTMDS